MGHEFNLNQIGFYQLENLILQRVPFKLILFAEKSELINLFQHLNPYYLNFLDGQIETFNYENEFEKKLNDGLFNKEQPMVIVCPDGKISESIIFHLEKLNFINYYWIPKGLKNLRTDKM